MDSSSSTPYFAILRINNIYLFDEGVDTLNTHFIQYLIKWVVYYQLLERKTKTKKMRSDKEKNAHVSSNKNKRNGKRR